MGFKIYEIRPLERVILEKHEMHEKSFATALVCQLGEVQAMVREEDLKESPEDYLEDIS